MILSFKILCPSCGATINLSHESNQIKGWVEVKRYGFSHDLNCHECENLVRIESSVTFDAKVVEV